MSPYVVSILLIGLSFFVSFVVFCYLIIRFLTFYHSLFPLLLIYIVIVCRICILFIGLSFFVSFVKCCSYNCLSFLYRFSLFVVHIYSFSKSFLSFFHMSLHSLSCFRCHFLVSFIVFIAVCTIFVIWSSLIGFWFLFFILYASVQIILCRSDLRLYCLSFKVPFPYCRLDLLCLIFSVVFIW